MLNHPQRAKEPHHEARVAFPNDQAGSENTTVQSCGALNQGRSSSCLRHDEKVRHLKKRGEIFYLVYMYPGLIELTRIFFGPSSQAIERAI